jgi:8-oxo-dGTP diphosphatase
MRRLGRQLWELPWPSSLRRLFGPIVALDALQFFLVPHFRCGVVGVIQNEVGEYLLVKHTYRPDQPWGLPTGFMEHGEQPRDALRREIREETGFTVQLSNVWDVYVDERSIITIAFRGHVIGGWFTPSQEISDAAFFQPNNFPDINPDQRTLLTKTQKEDRH